MAFTNFLYLISIFILYSFFNIVYIIKMDNSQAQTDVQPLAGASAQATFYDPNQDIDLSAIEDEIIDTSRGDKVDYDKIAFNRVYRFKCLNCGFMYEGGNYLNACPRCGSNKLDDSETTQTS